MYKQRIIIACICLLVSTYACADGPNYQVFPQLKTLTVSYHVDTNKRQTVIYATNHEKFSITCDAEMTTNNLEKTKRHETLVAPKKTVAFSFPHRSSITHVKIYLMCETSNNSAPNPSEESVSANDIEKTTIINKPETLEKPIVIIEEDLEKISY